MDALRSFGGRHLVRAFTLANQVMCYSALPDLLELCLDQLHPLGSMQRRSRDLCHLRAPFVLWLLHLNVDTPSSFSLQFVYAGALLAHQSADQLEGNFNLVDDNALMRASHNCIRLLHRLRLPAALPLRRSLQQRCKCRSQGHERIVPSGLGCLSCECWGQCSHQGCNALAKRSCVWATSCCSCKLCCAEILPLTSALKLRRARAGTKAFVTDASNSGLAAKSCALAVANP
mmetsp:Transcript_72003/g.166740  ORF Transcript_72003/g.166740 Transcript_72003/m.166740 type:complete len:231 (+) Transcript_72003:1420-2112(+)